MSDEKITKPVRLDDLVYVRTYIDTRQDELRAEVDERLEAIETGAESNVQSDWTETNASSDAYIKNKPTIPTKVSELTNDKNYSTNSELQEVNSDLTAKINNNKSELDTTIDALTDVVVGIQDNYVTDQTFTTELAKKVDKVTGKGLSTNDYTTAEKNKLAGLSNYDDTAIKNSIAGKVDKTTTINSKPLSSNITLNASDVGALSDTTTIPKLYDEMGENTDGAITQQALSEIIIALGDEFGDVINELNTNKANKSDLDAKYTKPSTGIPKTDLASDIQTSLGKADTALQSVPAEYVTDTELNNKGYASQSDLNDYLPLEGGDMTGMINHKKSNSTSFNTNILGVNGASIVNTYHQSGSASPTEVQYGNAGATMNLIGKSNANPKYNGADIAMKGDIKTKTSELENDAGFITTAPEGVALYDSTGSATDGAMTQKAATEELNKKVDKGTTLTGGYLTQYTTDGKIETTNLTPGDVTTLNTAQTITGAKSYNANNHLIATCSSAYSATSKTASLTGFSANHLVDGCEIYVKFTNGNSAGSATQPVTLNVNSTGAKTMVISQSAGAGTYTQNLNVFGWWNNNDVIKFVYDATYNYWVAVENVTQHRLYSVANTTLYSSTGTSETGSMTQKAITDALNNKINLTDFLSGVGDPVTNEVTPSFLGQIYVDMLDGNVYMCFNTEKYGWAKVIMPNDIRNFVTTDEIPDISAKADKVSGATADNLASLDANGNLQDSGFSVNNGTNDSFGKIPCISTAGVLEGGKYIDFHETSNDADFSVRLQAPNVTGKTITLPSATGTLALTSNVNTVSMLPGGGTHSSGSISASGTKLTAPCTGYLQVNWGQTTQAGYLKLNNSTSGISQTANVNASNYPTMFIPVKLNDSVEITYTSAWSNNASYVFKKSKGV